ncbi:hypothetical protein DL89DRAFT_211223, partial [Linderina pennispora]
QLGNWRPQERLRTVSALLVTCLNLGTDPPDLVKPAKSSVLEAWVDPNAPRTPMKQIMENLQRQFETIQRHARYKALPDCAIEDLKKYCVQFRRGSKDGRIMFYYNGHGVPRPTGSGDIWVFNRQFTQYIPVSAADLMAWVGTPGAYIWDCSHAMSVVAAFQKGARAGQHPQQQAAPVNPALISLALLPQIYRDDIHFAATRSSELLPTNPVLPADLFTSCLTTPVRVAMRFWVTCNPQAKNITVEMCEQLPGSVQDRRTPLGELNWILTSITDTIAWTTVPRELFSRLFRQDMMLSTLFRNYILADHIMRYYGVHPYCSPELPPTHKHPLWASLDLEIDMCLQQLPRLIKEEKRRKRRYISSSYFSNQLHAFEVWLQHAATVPPPGLEAPDELPAVLQVLLSQQYRLRSLILLYRFMNLGPWAVNLSMAVGIFPYISKLLASTTTEIREILILVWARLSAVDHALHPELLKNNSFTYFVSYLANNIQMQCAPVSDKVRLCDTVSAASAFTLTILCRDHE